MTARFELYYRPVHPHYAKEGRNTFSERMQIKREKPVETGERPLSRDYVLGRKPLYNCGGGFLRLCLDMIPHTSWAKGGRGRGLNLASVCKSPSWQTAGHLHKLIDNDALEVEAFPSDSFLLSGPSSGRQERGIDLSNSGRSRAPRVIFMGGNSQFS